MSKKMGVVKALAPVLTAIPVAAQARAGRINFKMDADTGGYLAMGFHAGPGYETVKLAKKKDRHMVEDSYSGTGSKYVPLKVETDPAKPGIFVLTLNGAEVLTGLIQA